MLSNPLSLGIKRVLLLALINGNVLGANNHLFSVIPLVRPPSLLFQDQTGTAIYQVTNNTHYTKSAGLNYLPMGVSQVTGLSDSRTSYCASPLILAPGQGNSCLIKLAINGNLSGNVHGGPIVCFLTTPPIYCSQPFSTEQLNITLTPPSNTCESNVDNFNNELATSFDDINMFSSGWGPGRQFLPLSSNNPNLTTCISKNPNDLTEVAWMQNRVLAAEDFWVKQKINYCHHYVPDYATPITVKGLPRTQITSGAGFCSDAINIMPNSRYYGQPVRWNYSGLDSETSNNWINNNQMWYGIDCSDFTSFIYNFAFGIQFNSDTGYQAGQKSDGSQNLLTPNGQQLNNPIYILQTPSSPPSYYSAAGVLVCLDGTVEGQSGATCHPGNKNYLSVFYDAIEDPVSHKVVLNRLRDNIDAYLGNLLPGDLIFLGFPPGAGKGSGNNPQSLVTHVVTWTGKKVGYGVNEIHPKQIAPESICPNNWQPNIGDWVIIDSHYQGPDYRVFSDCFYSNNVWGVRRIIGYMQPS